MGSPNKVAEYITSITSKDSKRLSSEEKRIGSADNLDDNDDVASVSSSIDPTGVTKLHRGLKSRHMQLIALGGSIGTGLFLGSGMILATSGPAIYFVMEYFAEMALFLPVPGNGPIAYVNDFLSPSFGFAIGWNYWYAFSILIGAEVTAAAMLIEYWTTKVNVGVWITILLLLIIALNCVSVKVYGEMEANFVLIKVFVLLILIIVGIVIFFGGGPTHDRLGFRYWKIDPFKEHLVGGSTGRFLGFWTGVIKSGFSFITGPELITTAIGEAKNPRHTGKKAAKRFIYRLIFFYVVGSLVIGVIVASNDTRLGGSDVSASPFVIGIQNAGIPVLNHIINAAILTSATSAGNSFLYSSSRMLFSMAERGKAPKIFTTTNRAGIPYYAVAASSAFGFLGYLNVSKGSAVVFTWLSNLSTISGFIGWVTVGYAYLRWRKVIAYNGLNERLPYRSRVLPFGTYFVIIFLSILILTNGYAVFFDFNAGDFLAAYITLPIVALLYFGHVLYERIYHGNTNWLTPIEQIEITAHLDAIEQEDADYEKPVPKNVFQRVWFWIM
ncbi:put4 Probable proline-specific permease put4 [Candida maltosa Xu316]